MPRHTLTELNSLTRPEFTSLIGPVFEHSPWIAGQTWSRRPFANLGELLQQLCETVAAAGAAEQLALIHAHPDLVGRLALAGALTAASAQEQASAGLDQLTADEIARFEALNAAYRAKFGFPFVICARQNTKTAILDGFRVRLQHAPAQEVKTALEEIFKIAELRLRDLIAD